MINRFDQPAGWTAQLQPADVSRQFAEELQAFLARGQKPLVAVRDEVWTLYDAQPQGTTLYRLSPEDTAYLRAGAVRAHAVKGTQAQPSQLLVAVLNTPSGNVVSIPLMDLRHATDEQRERVLAAEAEALRVKELEQRLTLNVNATRSVTAVKKDVLNRVFKNMPMLVEQYAHVDDLPATPRIDVARIEQFARVTHVANTVSGAISENTQTLLTLRYEDVKCLYRPESRERARLHPALHGMRFPMGSYNAHVRLCVGSISGLPFLPEPRMYLCFERDEGAVRGLLHPHIQDDGSPCLGSYATAVNTAMRAGDWVGLAYILHDFLTSCSESGWYASVFYWANDALKEQYCSCGRVARNDEESCGNCGYDPSDDGDGSDDEEEEDESGTETP